jgi:hypothetical protein
MLEMEGWVGTTVGLEVFEKWKIFPTRNQTMISQLSQPTA